jgi:hypothetical protein
MSGRPVFLSGDDSDDESRFSKGKKSDEGVVEVENDDDDDYDDDDDDDGHCAARTYLSGMPTAVSQLPVLLPSGTSSI